MVDNLVWDHGLLRAKNMLWSPASSAYQGGRPFSGAPAQAVSYTGGGLWKARLIDVALRTREQINKWHQLEALLSGGTQTIIVPRCDRRHGPALAPGGKPEPFSDGTWFSDGTGFATTNFEHTLFEDAPLRATTIRIARDGAEPLTGGEHFSINHGGDIGWRLYRVAFVETTGFNQTVEIRPPLRKATSAGTALEFKLPRCVMRLANPDGMELTVEMLRRGSPTVEFQETF